jgi:hypothetical protein
MFVKASFFSIRIAQFVKAISLEKSEIMPLEELARGRPVKISGNLSVR